MKIATHSTHKVEPILMGLFAVAITSWLGVLFSYMHKHTTFSIFLLILLPLVVAITIWLYINGIKNTASIAWTLYRIILIVFWLGYVTIGLAFLGLLSSNQTVIKAFYFLTLLAAIFLIFSIAKRMGWIK